jgi:hypothetical protein
LEIYILELKKFWSNSNKNSFLDWSIEILLKRTSSKQALPKKLAFLASLKNVQPVQFKSEIFKLEIIQVVRRKRRKKRKRTKKIWKFNF